MAGAGEIVELPSPGGDDAEVLDMVLGLLVGWAVAAGDERTIYEYGNVSGPDGPVGDWRVTVERVRRPPGVILPRG